ncbi:glutamine ABC transporter ATP-binding protein [Caballeronia pedi]|uniref:Glutamine ABC transporter ATP-binding protein n=1 Tax=Caballeronia pedi TaxID=1777141 RepID=A0A158DRS9_9BURK|nr:amino acid ABC transporter ATP-binding protein [Caballeronia pedi]SAK97288.1 glutamine ABC transporter ATP-binding protein [Caballeronia pedi]
MPETKEAPIIETRALRKSYGELEVLRGVDLSVQAGERIVVMGSSGSGKSTFIRCLNGLEKIAGGSIVYKGRDITSLSEKAWRDVRRNMGMVFQDYSLFPHFTVLRNLCFAPVREKVLSCEDADTRARALLKRVGLYDKADAYPAQLSGGQQQRIAIVRSMMMQPDVMLFDEPTSALDPETVSEVLAIIDDLTADGLTSIVVTHETGFARRCADRIVFMDQGTVLESSPPDVFFDRPATERARRFVANHK